MGGKITGFGARHSAGCPRASYLSSAMWTQRIISHILFSIMLLVQVHAAVPHHHLEESGSCGAVCHAHAEAASSWWEVVVDGVHELVHRHAESASCSSEDDVYRPAAELEFNAWAAPLDVLIFRAIVAELTPSFPSVRPLWTAATLEVRSLRGPPNRG